MESRVLLHQIDGIHDSDQLVVYRDGTWNPYRTILLNFLYHTPYFQGTPVRQKPYFQGAMYSFVPYRRQWRRYTFPLILRP